MPELNEQPWAEFADGLAKEMIEHGATEAAFISRNAEEDRVFTNYYNCNFEKRCVLVGHLLHDIFMEVIEINADWIKAILTDDRPETDDELLEESGFEL